MSSPSVPLSYSLGADDISKIVDAILPQLSPFLPNLTKDEKYVVLHRAVLALSKGKTFSNKDNLNTLVKSIVTQISKAVLNRQSSNNSVIVSPDASDVEVGVSAVFKYIFG